MDARYFVQIASNMLYLFWKQLSLLCSLFWGLPRKLLDNFLNMMCRLAWFFLLFVYGLGWASL